MSGYGYAWEKLFAAVNILASGTGPLHERLRDAWHSTLERLWKLEHQFPDPDLRKRAEAMRHHFKAADGRLLVETLPAEEQQAVALEICSIYWEVCRRYALEERR